MRYLLIALVLSTTGCKEVECGDGTIERNGACEPADVTVDPAKCGANTMAVGDQCLPIYEPTRCDPATTEEDLDTSTNITTCIGSGGGGCGAALPCPPPSAGKQTLCGQFYDLETGEPFAAADADATRCDPMAPTTTGPCAIRITPYDAIAFAMNPATAPLVTEDAYVDNCGRWRLTDITPPTASPFIALGTDDIDMTKIGPAGVTNAVGSATNTAPNAAVKDLEQFIAPSSTTTKWAQTGGPTIAGGIYVMQFRQRRAPSKLTQAGVTVIKNMAPAPADDHYFVATDVTRERVEPTATVTGANGTALVTNVTLAGGGNTGVSTLPSGCKWSGHLAQTVQGIVFVQLFRPINNSASETCPL